jgi:uncharacterized protein with GYD domain
MKKYMFQFSYDSTGAQAVINDGGTARATMAEQLCSSLDGRLESFYFTFGADDAIAIAELPDDEAAAAVALTVTTGNVTIRMSPLMDPEQVDAAGRLSPSYSAPGS